MFFALSHGVHRGKLKSGKEDDRIIFLKKLQDCTSDIKFDIYWINKIQLFGQIIISKLYLMQKWALI